jgi:hypothetical protein
MEHMRKRLLEDFLLNKLNGYYLILYSYNHYLLAKLVFLLGRAVVSLLVFARLIPPRIQLSYSSKIKKKIFSISKTIKIEDIQEKAYFLWAEKGFPENTAIDNWLEAEKQMCV